MADVVRNNGAQPSSISYREDIFNSYVPRGKRDKASHTTSGRQHGSSQTLVIFFCIGIAVQAQASSQGANYSRTFSNGSLRRIRLLTTTLHVKPITRKQRSGLPMGISSLNGSAMGRFCGFTESVRSPDLSSAMITDGHLL